MISNQNEHFSENKLIRVKSFPNENLPPRDFVAYEIYLTEETYGKHLEDLVYVVFFSKNFNNF